MKRRSLFTGALALACGNDKMQIGLGIGVGFGFGGGAVAGAIPATQDLRLLSASSADLSAWYRAENNLTLNTTLFGVGTTPQVLTIGGNLTQTLGLGVVPEPGDTTKFRWSVNNGWDHWAGGQGISFASALGGLALGTTGIVLTAASSSAAANNRWDVCGASWGSIVGVGMTLDNVVDSTKGPFVLAKALVSPDGSVARPALSLVPNVAAGYLTNRGNLPGLFSGTNTAWHTFDLMRLTDDNISTLAVAAWSCSDTVSTTQKYLMSLLYGPGAAGGARYEMRKRVDAGGTVLATTFPIPLDFKWFVHEQSCDGGAPTTSLTFLNSGITVTIGGGSTWSNAQNTHNHYTYGGVKLGTGGVTNQMFGDTIEKARYRRKLTAAEADDVRQTMVWGMTG